jgi:hypothetical protein
VGRGILLHAKVGCTMNDETFPGGFFGLGGFTLRLGCCRGGGRCWGGRLRCGLMMGRVRVGHNGLIRLVRKAQKRQQGENQERLLNA